MVLRTAFLALLLLAFSACVTTKGSFCDVAHPIRLTAAQIDNLTDAQVAELLAHNLKGQKLCGWKP